jgi:uncharacterized repeat protein (TIGR03803 family)
MNSRRFHSATKPFFPILASILLATALASQPVQAQNYKFKVLHTFHGEDGSIPIGQLVRDAEGNFYGATNNGGTHQCFGTGCGTAFKMNSVGKVLWSYSFDGEGGFELQAGVFRDAKGNIYGTTLLGGIPNCPQQGNYGCGVVFKLDPTGKKETVLHKFTGNCESNQDGYWPTSTPVTDAAGNLYGTTLEGGPPSGCLGTVFKINGPGKETIMYDFAGSPDGANPGAGLVLHGHKLYGPTGSGGSYNQGTVFSMTTKGSETVLYNFFGGVDGGNPGSVLAFDSVGNLYGTTQSGGNNCGVNGCGTVFALSQSGGGWTQKTLYVFCQLSQCKDGYDPYKGPPVLDKAGNIYGTTYFGGYTNGGLCRSGCGTIFKVEPSGNETSLYSFTGGADGAFPSAGLTMDNKGNLYGTAEIGGDLKCPAGGNQGCGVVFELTP